MRIPTFNEKHFINIDKELIILFLLVAITAIIYFFVLNQRAFLNFFFLPVLLGAYFFGKRYAVLSAFATIILIFSVAYIKPATFKYSGDTEIYRWLDLSTWGGFILIAGYCIGHLYEKQEAAAKEIRRTYLGIIEMLSLVIDSVDQQTQTHSYRVAAISSLIAKEMGLSAEEIEDIRIAALLHDLGKIGVNLEILNKAGKLTQRERAHIEQHTDFGVDVLGPVNGRVLHLIPLILHHHERYDGKGYNSMMGDDIPLGARIIAVADVYDAMTSDRPYRKALTPTVARTEIISNSGTQYDPVVVLHFEQIFPRLETDSYLPPQVFRQAILSL
jgi:HD-GYP domain-containing protein (c-di-GMP phosphodiesterase class II)